MGLFAALCVASRAWSRSASARPLGSEGWITRCWITRAEPGFGRGAVPGRGPPLGGGCQHGLPAGRALGRRGVPTRPRRLCLQVQRRAPLLRTTACGTGPSRPAAARHAGAFAPPPHPMPPAGGPHPSPRPSSSSSSHVRQRSVEGGEAVCQRRPQRHGGDLHHPAHGHGQGPHSARRQGQPGEWARGLAGCGGAAARHSRGVQGPAPPAGAVAQRGVRRSRGARCSATHVILLWRLRRAAVACSWLQGLCPGLCDEAPGALHKALATAAAHLVSVSLAPGPNHLATTLPATDAPSLPAPALLTPPQLAVAKDIIAKDGFGSLYKGLNAGLLRQATYTTTRLGIFQVRPPPAQPLSACPARMLLPCLHALSSRVLLSLLSVSGLVVHRPTPTHRMPNPTINPTQQPAATPQPPRPPPPRSSPTRPRR